MYNGSQFYQHGRPSMPPGYSNFPGAQGAPPGMGPPPGMGAPGMMAAPGVGLPPGLQQSNSPAPGRPNGVPSSFQPPPNMPNINFSAPVIRLGTIGAQKAAGQPGADGIRKIGFADGAGGDRGPRPGLGADMSMNAQRQALRESMVALVPPTRDEVVRTIFVGNIPEGAGGDAGIESIMRTAGPLRWSRATDADGKNCSFGFALYDDMEGMSLAVEILKDIEVPLKKQSPDEVKKEDESEEEEITKTTLQIVVDENSLSSLEQYQAAKPDVDPNTAQRSLDNAKAELRRVLDGIANPQVQAANATSQDVIMPDANGQDPEINKADIVTIPLSAADDELADIPQEMRATVTEEIAAFRDRSIRRDLERLKREEEIEQQERSRNMASRTSRLASPPPSAPAGPGNANSVPLGPRASAPSGPRGMQIPRDYQKGVTFVNGSGINGAASAGWIKREDEDDSASDSELERRRRDKETAAREKHYLDHERRWINREKSRNAALEREKARDAEEAQHIETNKANMAKRLSEWDDDADSIHRTELYYTDHSSWSRNRIDFRSREAAADDRDRAAEERERAREMAQKEQAMGMADQFLARTAAELADHPKEPARFKMSLGAAAAQKAQQAKPKRTVAEVEGLLEDEEEADATTKRTLIPIKFDSAADARGLSDEERDQAVRQLAAEIPSDRDGLWAWDVKWEFVDEAIVGEKLRPFVEKKIVEYLGVQEQMLVEVVEEQIRKRGKPQELVEQLEGALDEEAEILVRKLWRMLIFFSESERKGLSS